MNLITSLSRSILLRLFIVNLVLGCLMGAGFWFAARTVFATTSPADILEVISRTPELQVWARKTAPLLDLVKTWFYPALAGLLLLMTLVQWLVLRGGIKRGIRKSGIADPSPKTAPAKKREKQGDEKPERESAGREESKRYYLHLISVLQRQGRLMDFFHEDLSAYQDAQIGAAVRSIHENCAGAVKKTIAPAAVIDKPEGQEFTVPAGFDPAAIKLTGNVTGDPPFTGVLRHRGWRAGRLELPVLSASGDPLIIAPAEVEIQ
ncbi:hypothetical protein HNR65_001042 [Desulfosalsimonas propionicica]|uniref:DUF2760 domain-containing protein n=1 Tax=Desulfosalsimonas propionicica TaxID=332175 RepID=A0A7W0C7R9_9BACT|nr:DUF2760 domain-containing protein [Desulfosalsimonas propionicica]MBA2880724.1 hypothetical protein [Desulfosalsimonas propionicica]